MHGVKRVLVFCLMIVILPAILIIMPLHLRKTVFADVIYPMAESDIIEIRAGISSIFCSKHTLRMSSNFNAFQLRNKPEIATNRKHIRLKKSMTLPDDTLEYWGFFLLKGAKVRVKFCSRYDGSRILIIHGHRELNLCGLTDHNKNKLGANYAKGHEQVQVFFEDNVEITEEKGNQDVLMEHENHGGEDLTEDVSQPQLNMPVKQNNSIQPKLIRKKLKKGTIHHGEHDPYAITDLQGSHHTEHILNHHQSSNSPAHQRDQSSNITNKEASRNHIPYEDFADQNSSKTHHSGESPPHRERLKRHNRGSHRNQKRQDLYDTLYKRSKRENVYDRKTIHGGNAINFTETDESNSVSSFETGLFQCFNGMILLQEFFRPKNECSNPHIMDTSPNKSSMVVHNVIEDGYYYYIFYSDNDHVQNEIHAIFDIYKPTYQYSNMSESQSCLNTTNCTFNISFLSDEIVVVEVPTRDGIEHEEDDITNLVSTCHPRSEIYAIFPITVLVLILCCSFL
ncbi:uncharacterized protein LOC6542251 isoform X3 [Drosophila erecta]|nr:uncharacterized protein LOC6542251 isoform X3 [Drosophila erecta]XP_026834985.1 uncharacterized protein LOC6542251 isoform X3 [Drosophila erecta]XP_026834986.1 uncharacterized protein LOC6542251 isoform X3 [Drosophila erecta]KQS70359.1 uncharacterized protein Dere_GG24046, isoform C [Drosophila erecta]